VLAKLIFLRVEGLPPDVQPAVAEVGEGAEDLLGVAVVSRPQRKYTPSWLC
jgi:hypothetical protein